MITFCTGNTVQKRRAFRSMTGADVVSVDNDEVLAVYNLQGKLYFAVGGKPFKDMSVEQYVSYQRSLVDLKPLSSDSVKGLLACVGFKGNQKSKLKKLNTIQYRVVTLASKLTPQTHSVFINFDGLNFCRKNAKQVNRFVGILAKKYEVFVAVSDTRFVPRNSSVINYTGDGLDTKRIHKRGKTVSKRVLLKKLTKCGKNIVLPNVERVFVLNGAV